MRLTILMLTVFLLNVSAKDGYAQKVTLDLRQATMEDVFAAIKAQTGYAVFYKAKNVSQTRRINIHLANASLTDALDRVLAGQGLDYVMDEHTIVITEKEKSLLSVILPDRHPEHSETESNGSPKQQPITGRVTDSLGNPLQNATVKIKGTNRATFTDKEGRFIFLDMPDDAYLEIKYVGYETINVRLKGEKSELLIILRESTSKLDQVVVQAYSTTTRKLNTGNIGFVNSEYISTQISNNPLSVLQGKIPGLIISQVNGLPGSAYNVQIRGRQSLYSGTQPLYVVDGVPFVQNSTLARLSNMANNSPFANLNSEDIERIDVLKDADATSIYGSQGANGVILITTRKAQNSKLKFSISATNGIGEVSRKADLLNLNQYLEMREEAFKNDGIEATINNAPDLTLWDQARYTDWQNYFIGGQSSYSDYQLGLTGGNSLISVNLGVNHNRQTSVFPDAQPAKRLGGHLSLSIQPDSGRFRMDNSISYSEYGQSMAARDMTNYIYLPPNAPDIYDSSGNLNWTDWNGVDNPMSFMKTHYHSNTFNLILNSALNYKIFKGLTLKAALGYNYLNIDEDSTIPISSQRPGNGVTGSASMQKGQVKNWSIDPNINYEIKFGDHSFKFIAGLSIQQRRYASLLVEGSEYTDDDLLGDFSAGGVVTTNNTYSSYRYRALYGNLNYNFADKYLLNFNIRRDGSSRFGPKDRYATFSAVGGAWIFSNESIFKDMTWLKLAKLRGSYGITGNDQITDYAFIDTWSSPFSSPYNGQTGLLPDKLSNPYLHWERTKKSEISLEFGILNNRLMLSSSFYKHISDNQLTGSSLPATTGYTSIIANLDAKIENKGLELSIEGTPVKSQNWNWDISGNISFPRNKLVNYPRLEESSDRYSFMVGQPLSVIFGYSNLGVNQNSGSYELNDVDGDGVISTNDLTPVGSVRQKYFGGVSNQVSYRKWSLDVQFNFVKQNGYGPYYYLSVIPGGLANLPGELIEARWKHEGDLSLVQRLSSGNDASLNTIYQQFRYSSASITDASYLRLRSVYLSYSFLPVQLRKLRLAALKLYAQGQNLWTLTNYPGLDPETQSAVSLPTQRIYAIGLQVSF